MIVINEMKVKYDKLDILFEDVINDIKLSPNINVIVDVKEIVRKLFRPGVLDDLNNRKLLIEEISSDIINITAHYRNYFHKKNKYSNFIFLYSFNECDHMKSVYPGYKKSIYDKYFANDYNKEDHDKISIVEKSIRAVELISKKIPNMHFIDTSEFDELVFSKYILSTVKKNDLNLILSNDHIMFQLLSNENTYLINCKGIKSDLLNKNNCFNILLKKDDINLSSNFIPLFITLSGNKKTSISGIDGVGDARAITIINKMIKDDLLVNSEYSAFPLNNIDNLNDKIYDRVKGSFNRLSDVYDVVSGNKILYKYNFRFKEFYPTLKLSVDKRLILKINSQVYNNFPIQIDMITKGEL